LLNLCKRENKTGNSLVWDTKMGWFNSNIKNVVKTYMPWRGHARIV